MKKKNKKSITGYVLLAVILVIVVIGVSYAAYRFLGKGEKTNTITLGSLELTLREGNMINLENTYPVTDEEGLAMTGYDFTLTNTGTASVNYKIYLDNVEITSSETRLDDKYLKYSLDIDSAKGTAKYLTTLGPDGERLLDQGTLKNSEKKDYVLRIWPTVEVDGDFGGQVWKGKLRITGDQLT